jgi:hypothetical protein
LDPSTSHSEDLKATPFTRAFGKGKDIWSWFEEPGNESRLKRFGGVMTSIGSFIPLTHVISGSSSNAERVFYYKTNASFHSPEAYDWKSLEKDDLVVDVGGGVGTVTLLLAKSFPHLRYVVQDRPAVVPDGIKVSLVVFLFYNISSGIYHSSSKHISLKLLQMVVLNLKVCRIRFDPLLSHLAYSPTQRMTSLLPSRSKMPRFSLCASLVMTGQILPCVKF